jgi:hypothetical protein
MLRKKLAKFVSIIGLATIAFTGTAAAQPYPPYPHGWYAPPPPRHEFIPVAPGGAYIWRPGHWVWSGHGYDWVSGAYLIRQPAWHHWIDGHWAPVYGRWTWIPGHWG